VTPDAFPSVERLAGVIEVAGELGLPMKFTAGLHHPVRHQATEPVVMMHGFLNVFGAAMLAFQHGLDGATLAACLGETDPAAFSFDDGAFQWRHFRLGSEEVSRWRQTMLAGFVSCSFDEPCDDLRDLKLLD
jgi:hypothetical protein